MNQAGFHEYTSKLGCGVIQADAGNLQGNSKEREKQNQAS